MCVKINSDIRRDLFQLVLLTVIYIVVHPREGKFCHSSVKIYLFINLKGIYIIYPVNKYAICDEYVFIMFYSNDMF